MRYFGEPSQVAAGGRPLAVAAEVGREGGEGGAVREAARAIFESVGEGAAFFDHTPAAARFTGGTTG